MHAIMHAAEKEYQEGVLQMGSDSWHVGMCSRNGQRQLCDVST